MHILLGRHDLRGLHNELVRVVAHVSEGSMVNQLVWNHTSSSAIIQNVDALHLEHEA